MFESKEKSLNCQFDGSLSMLEHSDFSQFIKTSSINDDVYKSTWQLTILVDLPTTSQCHSEYVHYSSV